LHISKILCTFAAAKVLNMAKTQSIIVKDTTVRSFVQNGMDYICITDIARQKNALEPKDVVKNWMRLKNTIEYLGVWEMLNNPNFKGVEFDPLLRDAHLCQRSRRAQCSAIWYYCQGMARCTS